MLMKMTKRPWLAVPILASLAVVSTSDLLAQSGGHRRPVVLAPSNPEDDRNPIVFKRNLTGVLNQAHSLGSQLGFAPETLRQIADLRTQLDTFGPEELAVAAEQAGPQIAEANQALARIEIIPGTSAVGQLQVADFPNGWDYDGSDLFRAGYPDNLNFSAVGDTNNSRSRTNDGKVCRDHNTTVCNSDADCPDNANGETCIDRSASGGGTLEIDAACGSRPSDETIRNLAIVAAVLEGVQMVMDRICGQEWFGFNISLVCIITDILFLIGRSIMDFTVMCADRWSDAENKASYDRLGYLYGDLKIFRGSVDNYFTSTTGPVFLLQSSVNSHFTDTTNQINLFSSSVDLSFLNTNTNIDNTRTLTNTNIDNTRTLTNTNIDNTRTLIQNILAAQNDQYLQAEIERVLLHRERLAIYYLPEAQGGHLGLIRQIVERTINNVEASHEQIYTARTLLANAITDVNAGRYKRAFNYFSTAYFEAIKILGESQIQ